MFKINKLSTALLLIISIGVNIRPAIAAEIIIADKATTVTKVDETKLLEKARAYAKEKALGISIIKCVRIILFLDRIKTSCLAVEFLEEATTYTNGKPTIHQSSILLWFDGKGEVFERAEAVVFEDSVIGGSPVIQK